MLAGRLLMRKSFNFEIGRTYTTWQQFETTFGMIFLSNATQRTKVTIDCESAY